MSPRRFAGDRLKRFVEGADRGQSTLFPAVLDDYVGEDNPVRAIDVFVDGLDLAKLGFDGVQPLAMGRPAYHPATQLKIYIYGYLNRVQPVEPTPRAGVPAQCRVGLVDRPPDTGLQDHCGFPQGQR